MIQTKVCTKCGVEKDVTEFYKTKRGKYGLDSECKVCVIARATKWREENPEKARASKAKYREENPEKVQASHAKYREENPEKVRASEAKYKKSRRTDPLFKLHRNISCSIRNAFKSIGSTKNKRTEQILGCTIPEFQLHLESLFTEGMTIYNHGTVWHIDHIIPISYAENDAEVIQLNHYLNLQPLFGAENLKKKNHFAG